MQNVELETTVNGGAYRRHSEDKFLSLAKIYDEHERKKQVSMHNYGMITNWKLKTENESTCRLMQTSRWWRRSAAAVPARTSKAAIISAAVERCICRIRRCTRTSNRSTKARLLRAPSG